MTSDQMPVGQLIQWIAVGLILVAVVIVIILKIIRFNRRLHCKDTPICGNCCNEGKDSCDCRLKDLKKRD